MEVLDLNWNKLRRRGAVAVAKGVKVQGIHRGFSLVKPYLLLHFACFYTKVNFLNRIISIRIQSNTFCNFL